MVFCVRSYCFWVIGNILIGMMRGDGVDIVEFYWRQFLIEMISNIYYKSRLMSATDNIGKARLNQICAISTLKAIIAEKSDCRDSNYTISVVKHYIFLRVLCVLHVFYITFFSVWHSINSRYSKQTRL